MKMILRNPSVRKKGRSLLMRGLADLMFDEENVCSWISMDYGDNRHVL